MNHNPRERALTAERLRDAVATHNADRSWFDISNADNGRVTVRVYGSIGGWFADTVAAEFVERINAIDADEIEVQINSPGGNVFDGIAIYNALRAHRARIITRVDGLAASIASIIAQAGDERLVMTGAQLMIHDPWMLAIGNAAELRDSADFLDKQGRNLADIYAERTSMTAAEAADAMSAETWYTATEAVAAGLADSVTSDGESIGDDEDDDVSNLVAEMSATIDNLVAATGDDQPFSEHVGAVVAAVDELTKRANEIVSLRKRKGKGLSQAATDAIEPLADRLRELLALTDADSTTEVDDADARARELALLDI